MADQKLVIGRRLVPRKYMQDGKECVVEEWQNFSEYVPLSAEDKRQRVIDEAAHQTRLSEPPPKSTDEIIKELMDRVQALETGKAP